MTLPGRLSIALLEEDNPVKSYFRMRPILVREEERIELFQSAEEVYPSEGYIRIVPDKNEMSFFKGRMRTIGRYCMLDLRRHPGENDKIRPNKNYAPEDGDRNAFIVYSDVIAAPSAGLLTQVIDLDEPAAGESFSARLDAPVTPYVAVRAQGAVSGPWKWEAVEGEEGMFLFTRAQAEEWGWQGADQPSGILLSLPQGEGAGSANVYVNVAALGPDPEIPRPAPARVAPAQTPAAPARAQESAPAHPAQEKSAAAEAPAEEPRPEKAEASEPKPTQSASGEPALRMTTHRAINMRITMREQALLAQMGINPRRGRSLYEIVDEQWRKSRIDQLGHPVPAEATGSPADDPVENAMTAIRAVLHMPEARASLIEEMLRNETLNEALSAVYGAKRAALNGDDACMTSLEAERLALSAEVDALRLRRETERGNILEEVRTQYAKEFSLLDQKKEALQADIAALRETEEQARAAATTAVEALEKTLQDDVDDKLLESAMQGRAKDLILGMRGGHALPPRRPVTTTPTASELISDVRAYFERAGRPISNDAAVNLLACMTLGRVILISGPVGSGKRDTVRLLAGSLGISEPEYKRFAMTSSAKTAEQLVSEGGIVCDDEAPSLLMLNSGNNQPDIRALVGGVYGAQMRRPSGLRTFVSIDDMPDAYPVPAALYDRTYMIRLGHMGADTPWRPAGARPMAYGKAVSLDTLGKIFAPVNDLPGEMELRMTAIREQLDKLGTPLSRRSLDALWRYCSAVLPYMQCSPMELLDRAISQRGLPTLLSSMPLESLMRLPEIFKGMERCLKLLDEPLPLPALY